MGYHNGFEFDVTSCTGIVVDNDKLYKH
uniref:Uncharacterized protein n=1 Tax=Anguilla anguilla TaxID=7936 RepID=A0A0E9SUR8_ANGAN